MNQLLVINRTEGKKYYDIIFQDSFPSADSIFKIYKILSLQLVYSDPIFNDINITENEG